MNTKAKGYLLGAVAAATYGMNPLFALPLYKEGMDPDSVLFFRYLFAIPLVGAMLRVRRGWDFGLRARQIPTLVVLGLLLSLSSLALFLSYNYMDAGIASTLLFVYPIMVALIMAVGFHERLTLQTALCILLAVAGIGLLYRAGDGATLSLTGTLLVMTSSLSYAIYIVGVNRPSLRELPTLKVTFYVLLFGLSLFLVRLDFGSAVTLPGRWYQWGNLVALALFPTAISFLCTTSAIQYIGSTPTAILGALEPVTAVFFGVTIFGEQLTPRILCGMLLIIVAVSLIVAGNRISATLVRFRKLFPRIPLPHLHRRRQGARILHGVGPRAGRRAAGDPRSGSAPNKKKPLRKEWLSTFWEYPAKVPWPGCRDISARLPDGAAGLPGAYEKRETPFGCLPFVSRIRDLNSGPLHYE